MCVCVCVCVFIKLHITTQSGPVILVILCHCVCVLLTLNHKPIGPQPYPVIYTVSNPVRGLLDSKLSEEHLQSSNESI